MNECSSNPCQNSGTCNDGVNGYTCDCVLGFVGTACETGISTDLYIYVGETWFSSKHTWTYPSTIL